MVEQNDEAVPERPATWENVVVGEAVKAVGHVIGDEKLVDQGEDQVEIARGVREEYEQEHEE